MAMRIYLFPFGPAIRAHLQPFLLVKYFPAPVCIAYYRLFCTDLQHAYLFYQASLALFYIFLSEAALKYSEPAQGKVVFHGVFRVKPFKIFCNLKGLDPEDPVKYDFALCRLGILKRCLRKKDVKKCERCLIKKICVL